MEAAHARGAGRPFILFMIALLASVSLFTSLRVAANTGSTANDDGICLECHGTEGLTKELADGSELNLYVNPRTFAKSIHGDKLDCTDCHSSISEFPHKEREFAGKREYTISQYESCKRCHFKNYTKTLESVHYDLLSKGDLRAPVCVDCHGAHDIAPPQVRGVVISQSCARCHQDIYETYIGSVHGLSLTEEDNSDVPTCIDCHKAHSIEDARTVAFQLRTPEICGRCHGNDELMRKYGISSNVLKTYLLDFHGMTNTLLKKDGQGRATFTATCTDCHGIHDITKTDAPDSRVMKANLVKTCRKCHTTASQKFPDAWLSHYDPGPGKATLVYLVKLFYSFFIPFIIGGLILHIVLHVFRVASNR